MGNTIIEITQLSKRYDTPEGAYTALHDVNLSIEEGTIFGIIGLSGAGKSTLVRCINGLEPISGGTVNVLGQSVPDLSAKQLRQLRKSIGMVFQQYNLMPSRTVEGNVALALRHSGLSSAESATRHANCSAWSDSSSTPNPTHHNCPEDSSSESPSPARSPTTRVSCCLTRRPAH